MVKITLRDGDTVMVSTDEEGADAAVYAELMTLLGAAMEQIRVCAVESGREAVCQQAQNAMSGTVKRAINSALDAI